jgi:hypothetical protein
MKSLNDGSDTGSVNCARRRFLINNKLKPCDTTLIKIDYSGDNYKRYLSIDASLKGDGIDRESTFICDAVVIKRVNHAVLLPLADCIGAVLYDPTKNIMMVSHLGRHSLEQFGGTESVKYLISNYNIDPANLDVWLSPSAGKDSYPLFAFDGRSLYEVATEQIVDAGVPIDKIDISPIDSTQDSDYFSHSQFLAGKQDTDGRFCIVATII